ncbi:trehalose-phosphatase, partial [bacterium]|nr:trehalose-phosphatase [bacterium]
SIGWQPVLYLYRSLPFHSLVGLYCAADVAMVTPYRDGMNLIAKEYMASKTDGNGVLILSETAGAANELGEAIMVNPNNEEEMIESLKLALTMPDEERRERNRVMQNRLKRYNVTRWASDFMDRLRFIKQQQQNLNSRKLSPAISQKLMEDLKQSQRRLILLDYDGTLIPFADKPGKAEPDSSLLQTLKALAQNPKNQVVIISGRNKEFLEYWFGRLPIGMIAEHGVWIRKPEGNWELVEPIRGDWKEEIRPILEQYVDSTPKSFLEEKDYSLVWHYRQSQPELAQIRACELKDAIINLTENLNLGILEGSKVLEIKNTGVNKGATTVKWLATDEWDFVFAVGDDVTDEDIFAVLPDQAYSLKVGYGLSKANYNVDSYMEVRQIIKEMAKDTYDEAN